MPYNGNGNFTRVYNWVNDANNSIPITASRVDTEDDGIATGLSTAICKDGQTTITANLPMAGFIHTGVGNASAKTHYGVVGQIQDSGYIWGGTAGGTANALTFNTSPLTTALTAGQTYECIIATTNTAAATLAANGLAATAIKKTIGGALVALVQGDMQANTTARFKYDGTQFQLMNPFAHSHGADIASATTIVLDTATGDLVDVTGTTTITAITLAEGRECTVRFTGALTLTNGASLVLPGGANITTAAGDYAVFKGYASGVVRAVFYTKASGQAIAGGFPGTEATLASATTTDLGTTGVYVVSITGTTTITSFGSTAVVSSPLYFVRFTGALTLTQNATSLILPGAANITTAAGDSLVAKYEGSGNWRVLSYSPAVGSGQILQQVRTGTTSGATGATVMPFDNTIPQNTEGTQFLTQAITPKSASSVLEITIQGFFDKSSSITQISGAIFVDATANAIAAQIISASAASDQGGSFVMTYYVASASTTARTYKFRAGLASAGTVYFNQLSTGAAYGGVSYSSIAVTEYAA